MLQASEAFAQIRRVFSRVDSPPLDDDGFLDLLHVPRPVRFDEILEEPIAWVVGAPWLGKSTVCDAVHQLLRAMPTVVDNLENDRITLTRLGGDSFDRVIPPPWWQEWRDQVDPRRAIWLIDGVDEGLDRNRHLFDQILQTISETPVMNLRELRLILFTRPHADLGDFRKRLHGYYSGISLPPDFWLGQLDRGAAEILVGADRFPAVLEVIRRNGLKRIAGLPIVLAYLTRFHEVTGLNVIGVWRGILDALLGEKRSNPSARFMTTNEERFAAACRIAAVLTIVCRDTIREYSPDQAAPTIPNLFAYPENRLQLAAGDVCKSAAFLAQSEAGAFRFAQRNIQDWFTAFALVDLPLSALRSVLAAGDGRIVPRLRETARLTRTITGRDDIRTEIDRLAGGILLPSDTAVPTLPEMLHLVDRLEDCARDAAWGLRYEESWDQELGRLRVEGLGHELAARLRDPVRPPQVKRLLLRIAEATYPTDCADAAVILVLDVAQPDTVREEAITFVVRFGGAVHLQRLEGPIAEQSNQSDIAVNLRCQLLTEFLDRNYWPTWRIALNAPNCDPDSPYACRSLLRRVIERLGIDDARHLLPHMRRLYEQQLGEHTHRDLPELIARIMDLAAPGGAATEADADTLVQFALGLLGGESPETHAFFAARAVGFHLQNVSSARRSLYAHDIEVLKAGQTERTVSAWGFLKPEDWRWLRDQAADIWSDCQNVWEDAYRLALGENANGNVGSADWSEFVSLMDQRRPGLRENIDERIRIHSESDASRESEHEPNHPVQQPLTVRIQQVLDEPHMNDADRMRNLGFVCFSGAAATELQASGQWAQGPNAMKDRVWDVCRRGLESGTPTQIPQTGAFPGTILGEGTAFSEIVLSANLGSWLTVILIERWLPTALFAGISTASRWANLIRTCWAVSQQATERVILRTIVDEVQRREQPFALQEIPSECWTDAMTKCVVELIEDVHVRSRGRRSLLEQLYERSPDRAVPIATEWASRDVSFDDADQIRQAGRNILLRTDPAAALKLADSDFTVRGTAALEELSSLTGWPDESRVQWDRWPVEILEQLGGLLLRAYPPSDDPEFHGGSVSPAQELRWLRGHVIDFFLRQRDKEYQDVLDRFAVLDDTIRELVRSYRASDLAAELLGNANLVTSDDSSGLSVHEAVQLLDRAGYRLIQSPQDLFDAVCEILPTINADVGHDLPMLYHAPRRRTTNAAATAQKEASRKHLDEDALRAYVRRRLADILPRVVDGVEVLLLKEDQIGQRRRLDIRVTAPCVRTRLLAQVVIEVKWSDNKDIRDALVDQLGRKYMIPERFSHGIFFVGWTGAWPAGRAKAAGKNEMERLRNFLDVKRDEFCGSGSPGEHLRIETFILDARWRTP